MSKVPASEDDRDALKHAWDWFALHAGQRMQAVNHFLIAFALVLAGYGAAFQAGNHLVALGLALAGVLMSVSFLLLELRNRQLVQVAEPALAALQRRLADRSDTPELRFVEAADVPTQMFRKYSFVIRAMMCAAIAVMVLAALVAALDGAKGSVAETTPQHGHSRSGHTDH